MNDDKVDFKILGKVLAKTIPETIFKIIIIEAVVFFFSIFGHYLFQQEGTRLYFYTIFMIGFGVLIYKEYYKILKEKEKEKEK